MLADRVAAAPASWGICEVPGWGYQLSADRVLAEMRQLGLRATELGPEGFVPGTPAAQRALLESYGLTALGAFCPLVLHEPTRPVAEPIRVIIEAFAILGAEMLVIAAASGSGSYDQRPDLSERQWHMLTANLRRISVLAEERGITACFHPHIGTLIQTSVEVERVLADCDIPLCLDSGHLTVAGCDPLEIARMAPGRIAHVHLKDVDAALAGRVREGKLEYSEAVRRGMYTSLGCGDVDLAAIVFALESSGYRGWYVPELDQMLPGKPHDDGPIAGVRRSIEFLCSLEPLPYASASDRERQ